MRFNSLLITLLTLTSSVISEKVDYTGHKLYRFDVTNESDVAKIKSYVKNSKADSWNTIRVGKVDLRLTPEQSKKVKEALPLKYEILSENIQDLFNKENITTRAANFSDSYHSISEINSWLDSIAAGSRGSATISSIGNTYEGRPIKAITFRKPGASPSKSIIYHGGIHAREWISPATVITLISSFSKYASDADISKLLDSFEYTFIPVVNVDGYEYTRNGDRLWRKNRQPNSGGQCEGTDVNRNWGYQWQGGDNECDETYPGSEAFSAPESKAVADFISSKGNVISYIDFHSYGQLFMSPFGYTCDQNPDDFDTQDAAAKQANAALRAVNGRNYQQGTICSTIYQAYGSSVDWAYVTGGVKYPYAIELPDTGAYGFALPPSYIPSTGKEILAAVKALGKYIKTNEGL
ncbi:hypothetical protein K502DRAFT_304349 [Neoconidiobolus thromboides FSU 785]|nr:hypothetical protein K502DRAFT_304349 [Neoconidiobolus thromboides FSU 785]